MQLIEKTHLLLYAWKISWLPASLNLLWNPVEEDDQKENHQAQHPEYDHWSWQEIPKKINQKGRQGSRTAKNTAYISLLVLHGVSIVILEIGPYMDRLSLIIGSCIVIDLTYTT